MEHDGLGCKVQGLGDVLFRALALSLLLVSCVFSAVVKLSRTVLRPVASTIPACAFSLSQAVSCPDADTYQLQSTPLNPGQY